MKYMVINVLFFVVKNQVIIFREIQQELARSIQFQSLKSIGECITVNEAGERCCPATFFGALL